MHNVADSLRELSSDKSRILRISAIVNQARTNTLQRYIKFIPIWRIYEVKAICDFFFFFIKEQPAKLPLTVLRPTANNYAIYGTNALLKCYSLKVVCIVLNFYKISDFHVLDKIRVTSCLHHEWRKRLQLAVTTALKTKPFRNLHRYVMYARSQCVPEFCLLLHQGNALSYVSLIPCINQARNCSSTSISLSFYFFPICKNFSVKWFHSLASFFQA